MDHHSEEKVDALNARLAEIQDALLALPRGPSAERYALLSEQDKLRAEARAHDHDWDSGRTTEDLLGELRSLQALRDHNVRSRTGYVTSKGGSAHGPTAGAWVELGQQSLAQSDVGRLTARISELESLLEARGEPSD